MFYYIVFNILLISIYFRIANKYNIIDRPNTRSSHDIIVIRGAGILFPIAFLVSFFFQVPVLLLQYGALLLGLLIISTVSLLDDLRSLNSNVRLMVHFLTVALLLFQVGLFTWNLWYWLSSFIVVVGVINGYNFMDGINGITALYSLVIIGALFWINQYLVFLLPAASFVSLLAAILVFSFFNVRVRAKCFAGDVGSISMAFIICFLLLILITQTRSVVWILFLGIYGIDTVFTIFCRLVRKEPIFKAHRSHFYQFLANELKWSHVAVSSLYALVQFLLNCIVIGSYETGRPFIALLSLFVILLVYIIFRLRLEGWHRLFTAY